MTSRFTPTWDILNPRSAAAQGFLTPYLHSDPDLVYRFQHFVPKWIESHQRRLAGTPAFRRRLIELTHPQQYVPHCKTDRAPSLGLGREHRVAGRGADKEFVCNLATFDLRNAVLETSGPFPRGVNEMDRFELAPAPSRLVRPPRAAASPCALECRLLQIIDLKDLQGRSSARYVAFGQVVGVRSRVAAMPTIPWRTRCLRWRGPKVLFPKEDAAK